MADVAYATPRDVEDILPPEEELPAADSREERNLKAALLEATDAVEGYLEREYTGDPTDDPEDMVPDDVPGAVRRVTARVALRSFSEDPTLPAAESEVNLMGPFSHTVNWSKDAQDRSVYLTDWERKRIDKFKIGYTGGAGHVPMAGAGGCWYAP